MSKPQRRKGNAKNASSSAAHAYLSDTGATFIGLTPEMNIFEFASSAVDNHNPLDDEARIVLRKLVKKDSSTREKGLRELITFLNEHNDCIESCYQHFYEIVDRLSTDGSPTVRLLTMKVVSYFITKLKKSAAKGLKKILPMVLFELCDVSNSVCAAADTVLRENFASEERRQNAIDMFGPSCVELCVSLATQSHELCNPAKYDAEELVEQRRVRLETQALNAINRIATMTKKRDGWMECARKLFENASFVKKTLSSDKNNLKTGLVTLCLMFPNHVELMLNSPIAQWILASLDSEVGVICEAAWSGLIVLLADKSTFAKLSLQKAILPRILFAIRKKKEHWKEMGRHLLPCVASLHEQFQEDHTETKSLAAIIESFLDNLPFDASVPQIVVENWATSFVEVTKWVLSSPKVNRDILDTLIPTISKMAQQSSTENTVASLIHWIFEKSAISDSEAKTLCDLLESGAHHDLFYEQLLQPGKHVQLCTIHASLINKSENAKFYALKSLKNSQSEYFKNVVEKITNHSLIEPIARWNSAEAEIIADLIERFVNIGHSEKISLKIENNDVCRALFLKSSKNTEIWRRYFENRQESTDVIQNMLETWKLKGDGASVAATTDLIHEKNLNIKTDLVANNLDYIVSILKSSENLDAENVNQLCLHAFSLLFVEDVSATSDHYATIAAFIDPSLIPSTFFHELTSQNFDIFWLVEIASRFDKFLAKCDESTRDGVRNRVQIQKNDISQLISDFEFIIVDGLLYSSNVPKSVPQKTKARKMGGCEAYERILKASNLAVLNLAGSNSSELAHGFAAAILAIAEYCRKRYPFIELHERIAQNLNEIALKLSSPLVQRAFATISSEFPWFDVLSAGPSSCEFRFATDETNQFVEKCVECDGIEFLEFVLNLNQQSPLDIFTIAGSSLDNFIRNYLVLKRIRDVSEKLLDEQQIPNKELVDFLLCGVITMLHSVNDFIDDVETSPEVEFSAAICLEIFAKISASTKNRDDSPMIVEWVEFYSPTIIQLVFNWLPHVKSTSAPSPFLHSMWLALNAINELPDLESHSMFSFVPELDAFNYLPPQQFVIENAFNFLKQDLEEIQIIGLVLAKLLMPLMFKNENSKRLAMEVEESAIEMESLKIQIPYIIRKTLEEASRWTTTMLFDVCLVPFDMDCLTTSPENRMAYCDTLATVIRPCLEAVLINQPQVIPRNQEKEYYTMPDITPSTKFYDKYVANLLFRILSRIPAAARLWYKSLPTNAASIVHDTIQRHVSRLLIDYELEKVRMNSDKKKNADLKIRVIPVSGEVVAEYTVDETTMRLTIGLPADWPLTVPSIQLDKAIVKSDRAKKWLLQLTAYLFHQNGSTVEGIEMWRKNVDRDVEGAEACCICMMTIHSTTHQMPRVKCRQCKNKFHANCLYKWFESSNQSSCPLCRASFT
ncbi:unnamed protein product [Caenorhabditis bovis]|uniref:E3 ubiquitin-protein ligase listerin n=1 Tax=Caenorhabditis bovis TaxID=2654633 RepID=A0A8S1FET8_9PELO|nr:unnamed protein product [Caenorhabditis bovis]